MEASRGDKCEAFAHCFLRLQWRGVFATRSNGQVMSRLREVNCQKHTELWKNPIMDFAP